MQFTLCNVEQCCGFVCLCFTPMSFATLRTAIEHVGVSVPLGGCHPCRGSAVDAFKAAIERRIPRPSHIRTGNLLAILHRDNLILAFCSLLWKPCITTFFASLEEVCISVHGICHPLGIRIALGAEVALKIGIKGVVDYPVVPFLDTVISCQGAVGRGGVPSGTALFGCLIQVMFSIAWLTHPHGIITPQPAVGLCQMRIVELLIGVWLVINLLRRRC